MHRVTGAGQGGGLLWTHATANATETNFGHWSLHLAEAGRYKVEVYTAGTYAQSTQAKYVPCGAVTRKPISTASSPPTT